VQCRGPTPFLADRGRSPLPFIARDERTGIGFDGLQLLSADLARPQADAVIAKREIVGIEIDRRELLLAASFAGLLLQPRQRHRLVQTALRCGELEFDLRAHGSFHFGASNRDGLSLSKL
jgi:hypothetical protein